MAGLYVLLRPNVANAPGPEDPRHRSVSELQVAGEALALFAVPAGVASALGRLGFGIISSFAISGATTSVAYRGVQDVGAGEFSGVQAYVVDATTGAVIGVVIGGVFRPFIGAKGIGAGRPGTRLVHLTDEAGHAGITTGRPPTIMGRQGIYAVPESVAGESTALKQLRTLLPRAQTQYAVPIPKGATGAFSRPLPVGPASLYQRLAGVYRAPAGTINLASGQFAASGGRLANITGQFWPYGADAAIWVGAGFAGISLSPSGEQAYQRGLFSPIYNVIRKRPPLPMTTRSDGPFVFVDPALLAPRRGTGRGRPAASGRVIILVAPRREVETRARGR